MSDKNQHINKDDHFSQLVKQKLENHQLPAPDDIWAGIEQKLAEKPQQRRLSPWYWLAGGVAAAAVALMLLLRPVNDIPQVAPTVSSTYEQSHDAGPEPSVTVEEPASDSAVTDNEINPQSTPAAPKKAVGLTPRKSNNKNLYADTHIDNSSSHITDEKNKILSGTSNTSGVDVSSTTRETTPLQEKPAENTEHAEQVQSTTNKVEKIDKLPDLNDYPVIPEHSTKPKKKQKLLLAAAFGTGGNISSSQMEPPQEMMKAPGRQLVSSDITKSYSGILNSNDYSKAQHYAPVSVGITVEKPLTERLGIESGLVYTYLKSIYRDPGSVEKNGSLQLHYLGIPLNARVKALKKPKWNLYASAGVMVEKGLRAFYRQEVENNTTGISRQNDIKSNIEGLQWSLNGALGADYKLTKDLSLFIEPKLIYYLENNQPESARTEQPLNIGVNGGLRIEL